MPASLFPQLPNQDSAIICLAGRADDEVDWCLENAESSSARHAVSAWSGLVLIAASLPLQLRVQEAVPPAPHTLGERGKHR